MNLEDYFDMLHKMAQRNPQSPSNGRSLTTHQQDDDQVEEEEDPLPPEDIAET